jgi:hypothetical protein
MLKNKKQKIYNEETDAFGFDGRGALAELQKNLLKDLMNFEKIVREDSSHGLSPIHKVVNNLGVIFKRDYN